MITITLRLLGLALKTFHIALGIDLPTWDYKFGVSVVQVELSTGPATKAVPEHSVQINPTETPNEHPAPQVDVPPAPPAPDSVAKVKDAAQSVVDEISTWS